MSEALTPTRLDELDEMARAAQERAEMLTPVAGGHVFRGTWEALAELDTATCEACGEHIKQDGDPVDVVEHDGAGVGHRIMCDGWPASAAPGVLLLLARGMVREREAPDDVGDLLPARPSHEARAELYSAHWDASQPHADVKPPLSRVGKAFDALSAALSDEEHALRMALERDERSPDEVPALSAALRAAEAVRQRQAATDAADEVEATVHAARLALAEPDEEGDCRRCLRTMARPDRSEGEEATPLCAACAQALLPTLAAEVLRLREQPATPDELAAIEAAASEDKAVASRATARPWRWWTANSMRELRSEAGRRHEVVAYGFRAHDGVNDISIGETDMRLIERAVNGLVDRADALLRLAREVRRLRIREAFMAMALRAGPPPTSALASGEPPQAKEDPSRG